MNIFRLQIWEQHEGATVLAHAAKGVLTRPYSYVKTYELRGGDGTRAEVAIFPLQKPPVALVSPDSAEWAETAVDRLFDERGNVKPEKVESEVTA